MKKLRFLIVMIALLFVSFSVLAQAEESRIRIHLPDNFVELVNNNEINEQALNALKKHFESINVDNLELQIEEPTKIGPIRVTTFKWKLGSITLPNEHRLHRHSRFDYRWEVAGVKGIVYVTLTHPDLNDFINDAITCAVIAGGTSVVAALYATPAAGYAIFYPAWKVCMVAKVGLTVAEKFKIELSCDKEYTWENH